MSEQRWAVLGDAARNGWIVVHPGEVIRDDGRLDCWEVHSRHDTWTEAMQEADRMARTVTVTLPRLAPGEWTRTGNFRVFPERPWLGDALELDACDDAGEYFILGKEDCEPLALAILAHARGNTADVPEVRG